MKTKTKLKLKNNWKTKTKTKKYIKTIITLEYKRICGMVYIHLDVAVRIIAGLFDSKSTIFLSAKQQI